MRSGTLRDPQSLSPRTPSSHISTQAARRRESVGSSNSRSGFERVDKAYLRKNSEVDADGCWIWTGLQTGGGYGKIMYGDKPGLAHRASYRAFKGEIPAGLLVLHTCGVKSCVNPAHLRAGTRSDSQRARRERERGARASSSSAVAMQRPRPAEVTAKRKSKLSEADRIEIASRRKAGETTTALASEFGVTPSWISQIAGRQR